MPINIKTPVYEGPLDLLLELIEKRKLLINDISLATVTDEYIARIEAMHELPVGETAEFVALAATLLLIKSRSLLPSLVLSDDETRDIKELEYRLAVYQIIKSAARSLGGSLNHPALYEIEAPEQEPVFIMDESVTQKALLTAAQGLIASFPTFPSLQKVAVQKIISLEEMIERLAGRVSSAIQLSFREFSGMGKSHSKQKGAEAKHSVIVSFLALLELVKQGMIRANQGERFGDIMLQSDAVATPSYE